MYFFLGFSVCACPEGVVGALSGFPDYPLHRPVSVSGPVFPDRRSLYRRNDRSLVAGRYRRSRLGDEVIEMIRLLNVRKGFNLGKSNEFIAVGGVTLAMEANRVTVLKGRAAREDDASEPDRLHGEAYLRPDHPPEPTAGRQWASQKWRRPGDRGHEFAREVLDRNTTQDLRVYLPAVQPGKGDSVLENVMLPAYPLGEKHGAVQERAHALIEMSALCERTAAKVEWLSGGEAQRVAIARALYERPPGHHADEPTAHLDSKLSLEFMDIIARLKDKGKTAHHREP